MTNKNLCSIYQNVVNNFYYSGPKTELTNYIKSLSDFNCQNFEKINYQWRKVYFCVFL